MSGMFDKAPDVMPSDSDDYRGGHDPYEVFATLTIYTDAISMQIRDDTVALHVMDGAQRSAEDGHPVLLSHAEARKVRDLLNMATARGDL